MPDGKVTNVSYNQYVLGCIDDWLYRRIGGLNADQPGYKHIVIKPEADDKLTHAKVKYHSVYGEIYFGWEKVDGKMVLKVVIPANTTASLWLPEAFNAEIFESGKSVDESHDIFSRKRVGNKVVIDIGAGEYVFEYLLNS